MNIGRNGDGSGYGCCGFFDGVGSACHQSGIAAETLDGGVNMTPQEITDRLRRCAKSDCEGCPYRYTDDYDAGCGKLLSDAALLLAVLLPSAEMDLDAIIERRVVTP